jgi:hypothetical protein
MRLRASLILASALIALAAAANASIMPEASESAAVPRSLYSPQPIAQQAFTLQTVRANSADYLAPPVYGSSNPIGHFEIGSAASGRFFTPTDPPSAALVRDSAKETL